MEDVLRILVIAGLALWAGWGFMVGLRAKEGRVIEVTVPPAAASADDDGGDDGRARRRA